MFTITINKHTQVQINKYREHAKTEMLKINAWSQIKASFKCWVLDTGKEISTLAFI